MVRQKIVLTGGSGLLALNWACAMRDEHEIVLSTHVHGVKLAHTTALPLQLDEPDELSRSLRELGADVIVHTAGMTNVEECERDPERARRVNADFSRNVAKAAARAGARLIHISTDHLFSGTRALCDEDDPPQPLNVYARTKLLAEQWVGEECPGALIVRTNFFGWGHRYRQSFSDFVYYNLREGKELTMFDDVFVTPILADRLAFFSHRLLELGASGIYHVAGDERISKYEFGARLVAVFGLPEGFLRHGKIAASDLLATRPPDMSLDNTKARERLGTSLGNIAEYLRSLKEQDRAGRRAELLDAVTE